MMGALAEDIRTLVAIGSPLTVSQLAAVLEAPSDLVLMTCDELVGKDMLADEESGLTLEGPDPNISRARRALFAERLVDHLASTIVDPARIGRLYSIAGRGESAVPLLMEAASSASVGHRESIELLTLAIDAAPPNLAPDLLGELHLARARQNRNAGFTASAQDDADVAISQLIGEMRVDALALASVLADDLQLAQESERWAAMALCEAARIGAYPKRGSLLSLHARELARLGYGSEAEFEQERGSAIAAAGGNEVQRFYTSVNAARMNLDTGDVRAARMSYEHLCEVALRLEGPLSAADKEAHLARACLLAGDVGAGLGFAESAIAAAEGSDAVAVELMADIALVEGLVAFHRFDEALGVADRLIVLGTRSLPAWRNRVLGYRAIVLLRLRRSEEAVAAIEQAIAATPSGADGLRLGSWLECWSMAANTSDWDQRRAEDLTDLLLQSGWLQTAAEFMVIRAQREDDQDLAAEAAALGYRLGQPILAADALEIGNLWSTRRGAAVADRLREVERSLPDEWRADWEQLPAVRSGLAVDVRDDGGAAEALRQDLERVLGDVLPEGGLSPAQRVATGAVRRRRQVRTVARTVLAAAAMAVMALIVVVIYLQVTTQEDLLGTVVEPPPEGLSGASPFAAGPSRSGVVEGTFGPPTGVYWIESLGGAFNAAPVVRGKTVFVGTSEGRLYSIDVAKGSTNFEESLPGRIEVAAIVESVAGFGESGQSQTLVFFGNDESQFVARKLGDTGEVVWRFRLDGPLSGPPIVVGSTVYAAGGGHVYAIDGPGGYEVARFPESPVEGGFTEALAADDRYLYAVGGGDLYMLDLLTLKPTCVVDLPARTQVVTHPVLADGAVFVGTSLRTIAVFSPGNCGVPPPGFSPSHQIEVPIRYAPVVQNGTIWMAADELVLVLDALSSGFEVVEVGGLITSQPVLAGGTLIMGTEGGRLVGVDVASRTVAWELDVEAEVRAPVAVVDQAMVVATTRGDLIALADG